MLRGKAVNLTPEQRKTYSRVKYDMEVWVNKATSYIYNNAALVPTYLDVNELRLDMKAHNQLNPRIDRISGITHSMEDINLLLGHDIYNSCMKFYRSVKAASSGNAPGATAIYADLKQQFSGGAPRKSDKK